MSDDLVPYDMNWFLKLEDGIETASSLEGRSLSESWPCICHSFRGDSSGSLCSFAGSDTSSGASNTIPLRVEAMSVSAIEGGIDTGSVCDDMEYSGKHPSVGSAQHGDGKCKPCHYIQSKSGCPDGGQCGFCHYKHGRRSTYDIPKAQRQMCQYLVLLVHQAHAGSDEKAIAEEQLISYLCHESRLSGYTAKVLRCFQGAAQGKSDVAIRLLHTADKYREGKASVCPARSLSL